MKLKLIKVYNKDLDYVDKVHGHILYCLDTRQTYYDNSNLDRMNISSNALYLGTETEKNNIYSALINRIYIIGDSNKIYRNLDDEWYLVENDEDLYNVISDLDDLTPSILTDKDNFIAPRTLASAVYMSDGTRLSSMLGNPNILTITRTKATYVEVTKDNQKIFTIPYPIAEFDLARNHMSFIARGNLYDPDRYVVNNDRLILNTNNSTFLKGEVVLFMFYYTIQVDLNDNVILHTKNIADGAITTPKLAESIRLEASKVIETVERIFMSPEERDKLRNVAYNATNYHHPATHPAIMIVQDDTHRMVSDVQIYNWERKANANEVYSKEEVEQRLNDIIGFAPENLDTLKEISDALNGDPNFANTMILKLSEKASKDDIKDVRNEMTLKTNLNDYVRNGIYNTTSSIKTSEGDYYNISIQDNTLQEYIDGMLVTLKIKETNEMKSFFQINNLGSRKILTQDQMELIKGELVADSIYSLRYNGSTGNFILQGKGGVKINHSALNKYTVIEDSINRGNLVDIIGDNVRNTLPRISLNNTSVLNNTAYYCDKDLNVKYLDSNRIVVSWIDSMHLKLQVFKIDARGNLIETLENPVILNSECRAYDIEVINSNKIIVTYSTIIKTFNVFNIDIEDCILNINTPYTVSEIEYPDTMNIVNILNKCIITWRVGELLKCIYVDISGTTIDIISTRNNLNYPIDHYVKINNNQILFLGTETNVVKGWVMNVDTLDFYNNTLITIKVSDVEDFSNLSTIDLKNNKARILYTNTTEDKYYSQILTIKPNGGIEYLGSTIVADTLENVNYIRSNKYLNLYEDIYVNLGKHNSIRPRLAKINDTLLNIYETNTSLFGLQYSVIDFDIKGNNLVIAYSFRLEDVGEDYLFFTTYKLQRLPNGVAMTSGIPGDIININEWN